VTHSFSETVAIFFGLAWEHEFDGETGGTYKYNGTTLTPESPSLSGSSAYGELGLKVYGETFGFQINAFGLAGQSKGAGGVASLVFTF
jgi:hypothetical protein